MSGYLFLKILDLEFKKKTSFLLVNPTKEDSKQNLIFLNKRNIYNIISYVAPIYKKNNISDKKLLKLIVKSKPNYIIAGEIQESLALYLRDNISFKTSILCTGAAIAFLTKRQAPINEFIDKYYLGWLFRVIYNPKKILLECLDQYF